MSKSLFRFGVFFLGLTVVCALFHNIARMLFGVEIYQQSSFIAWFAVANIVSLTGTIVVLKYFRYRDYPAAFFTGLLSAIVNFCFAIIVIVMLVSTALRNLYLPAALISLSIGNIYALTLVFSGTGKHIWLRIAGIYMFTIGLVLISTLVWSLMPKYVQYSLVFAQIAQWTSLAGSLISVPFILHFRSEIKLLKPGLEGSATEKSRDDKLITIDALALAFTLVLGVMVGVDGNTSLYWNKQNFEKTKVLARLFEARSYVNANGDKLRYRLLKPLNYDPKKRYPLVVTLPYGGQPGTDTIRQIEGAPAAEVLSTDINRIKYPAFILLPNCPPGSGWGGVPNYPSVDTLVYKAIEALDTVYSIDAKRRYVTGISRGGYGAWHFICTRPDLFAAAIPVSGSEDPKLAPRIVNVAVWAFHGALDKNVPVTGSRNMIDVMRKSGQKPMYTEYPDEGHNIWYQVSITPALWDWLFAQKREH